MDIPQNIFTKLYSNKLVRNVYNPNEKELWDKPGIKGNQSCLGDNGYCSYKKWAKWKYVLRA